ncbi:hypothetical protein [Paenibacillus glycanilyticus]|uniref:hypothetical protein n=1 Tax=Paenibacillus glycanilyticus TaxID=126569 RepID=UPI001F29156C|nr:hypothetical protein [Paenibacillus glycanilyticus]
MIAGILAATGICAVYEIPSLATNKKDLWVFCFLLLAGSALSIVAALHGHIANPLNWIAAIYKPLGYWMQSYFT